MEANTDKPWYDTAFFQAVNRKDIPAVKRMLEEGMDANAVCSNGMHYIYLASRYGPAEMVQLMIDCGADVLKADFFGRTPLQGAMELGRDDNIEVLQLAIRQRQAEEDRQHLMDCVMPSKKHGGQAKDEEGHKQRRTM